MGVARAEPGGTAMIGDGAVAVLAPHRPCELVAAWTVAVGIAEVAAGLLIARAAMRRGDAQPLRAD